MRFPYVISLANLDTQRVDAFKIGMYLELAPHRLVHCTTVRSLRRC